MVCRAGEPAENLTAASAAFPSSLQSRDTPPKALIDFDGRRAEGQKLHSLLTNPVWLSKKECVLCRSYLTACPSPHSAVTGVDINAAERPLLPLLRASRFAQFLLTSKDPESHLSTGVILRGSGKNTDNFLCGLTVITAEPAS